MSHEGEAAGWLRATTSMGLQNWGATHSEHVPDAQPCPKARGSVSGDHPSTLLQGIWVPNTRRWHSKLCWGALDEYHGHVLASRECENREYGGARE